MHKDQISSITRARPWYQYPVTWVFGLLLMLIVFISLLGIYSLHRIEKEFLQGSLLNIEKLRLLDEMVHHSRQRSVLLRDLVIASDPFEQDAIVQKHYALATQYLSARNELVAQRLTEEERKILDHIIELNSKGYAVQQQIIDLATSGEQREALELIANELAPNRRQIYPDMMTMREMLVDSSSSNNEVALELMDSHRIALGWLLAIAIVTGFSIAWLAYRIDSHHNTRLLWQACHDPLTGLGNRYEAESQIQDLIDDARQNDAEHALLYLDIDQFNIVNNTSGQAAGDELLKQLAVHLRESVDNDIAIDRVGSDQFVLLLMNQGIDEVKSTARQILERINSSRFEWLDRSYDITASIGIVPVTASRDNVESIWSDAYIACDVAKEKGGDHMHVAEETSEETKLRREGMDWTSRLRRAMNDDRLVLFSQGIKSMNNGIAHSEILVRYEEENGDIVPAASFIPAAERYNLITEIDLYVVRKTIQYMSNDNDRRSYSINLSGMSLGNRQLLDLIITELEKCDVDPERLCFEITETAAIRNATYAIQFMNVLHGLGCHFFLDDFGTGLSSFGYLKTLPLDIIKIDGHFIRNIEKDSANRSIIEAINTIAHGFGMKTVAEGVETETQLAILGAIGIDYVQGYLVERPSRLLVA
jgi:diguanylate cyclase (GGDEF)-like protein